MVRAVGVHSARQRSIEFRKLADEQVQASVVVVIKPHRAGAPSRRGHPGFRRHIGKSSVAVVVIQNAAIVLRDVQIRVSVPVVIPHRRPHPVTAAAYSRFFGNVCKRAVAIISVQRITQRSRRLIKIAWTAIHQVNVHPPIIVVIEKGATRPTGLRKIFCR